MGLGDIVDGVGGAIAGGIESVGMIPSKTIDFAKGIAGKAESFVEETAGPIGMSALKFGASVIEGPLGFLPDIGKTAIDAISDPAGFVSGIVASAEATASKALDFAKNIVHTLVQATLGGITALVAAATNSIRAMASAIATGIGVAIRGITIGFAKALQATQAAAMTVLKFGGKMAKTTFELIAQAKIRQVERLKLRIMGMIARAQLTLMGITHRAFALARAKALQLATKILVKSNRIVTVTLPKVIAATTKVMLITQRAHLAVKRAIDKVRPYLPGIIEGYANRIERFAANIATKALRLHIFFVGTVMPAAITANALLTTTIFTLLNQAFAQSTILEGRMLGEIAMIGLRSIVFVDDIARQLEALIQKVKLTAQGAIDTGITNIGNRSQERVTSIGNAVTAGGEAAAEAVTGAGPAHGGHDRAKSGIVGRVGDLLGLGGVGKKIEGVIDKTRSFTNKVIDGAIGIAAGILDPLTKGATKKRAHDGELTGPFFPQRGDKRGGHIDAEARHSVYDEASRRSMLKRGAHVFVNGIDTSLEDHYAAAQRLANELGRPVVGIYNASGGKGNDLMQCASDKLFDRQDNPATKTLVGILEEQGHRPGKKPTQIYAHSQGSLIVSEALRQAGKGGSNLQQFEVTTFGNAAWTFPQGPKYHHYVHDDDLVPSIAGTSSRISHLMNQTRVGRWLSERVLGKMADAQKDTVVLHHGGSSIGPHGINARKADGTDDIPEQKRDYIGHLRQFRAEERTTKRTARHKAIETSVGFSMARGIGQSISEGVASGYRKMDRAVSAALPLLPGNVASSLWKGISRRVSSFGQSIYQEGVELGASHDAEYFGRTRTQRGSTIQRSATAPESDSDADADRIHLELERTGGHGFAPDSRIKEGLAPFLGFDVGSARLHAGPAAAAAASDLQAKAFTIGRDVYFGAGQYNPASTAGMALIAHELTHVGQQTGQIGNPMRLFTREGGDSMEQEAQRTAEMVLSNAGRRDGLLVERLHKHYDGDGKLTDSTLARLEHISELALLEAERRLGTRHGRIADLHVEVDLDLNRMSDRQAADAWARAIVDQVGRSAIQEVGLAMPRLVQRTPFVSQLHMPATPPRQEGEMPGDDRQVELHITVMGERFERVSYPEALRALRNTYRYLRGQVQAGEESHHDYIDFRNDSWFTGGVSDLLSGARMPSIDIWRQPAAELEVAYQALVARDVVQAVIHLQAAARALSHCQRLISQYREGSIRGAEHAITGLETVATTSAIVVGTLATAGMGTGAALAVGTGYGALQTVARQGTEVALGLRDEIDWVGITFDAVIGLIVGRFMGNLTNGMAGRLLQQPAFRTLGRAAVVRIVQDVLTGRGSSILNRVARNIFDHARGSRDAMTIQQMIDQIIAELCDPRSYFYDLLSGMGGRAAERQRARSTGGAVHETPSTMDTPTGRRAQEVLDLPPPRPTPGPPAPAPPAPAPPEHPATTTDTPTTPTTEHPATSDQTAGHPPEAPLPIPSADAPAPAPHAGDASAIAPAEAATPTTRERPQPLERVTTRRRGESAAQRRRRITEEQRQIDEGRRVQESEAVPAEGAEPAAHPQEGVDPQHRAAAERHRAAMEAGGEPATAAAEQLMREVRSFRRLREMAAEGLISRAGVDAIVRARDAIQARIRAAVLANHPDLEFLSPGTTGFGSDTDVTIRPRRFSELRTPEEIARAVEDAGRAAQEANEQARALGAEPDEALDTNYYPYTGADSPLQGAASPNRAAREARTVASLAEQHQSMSPEAWAEYREQLMQQAAPSAADAPEAARRVETETRETLRQQLDRAEQMSGGLRSEREELARQIREREPGISAGSADMRAREQLGARYRERLAAALRRAPVNLAEVSTLQAQLNMIAPGAYASAAGIADVPYYQQQMTGAATEAPAMGILGPDGRPIVTFRDPATGDPTQYLESSEGTRRYMELNPVSGTRDLADSAGSSLAQLEAHAGHAPSSTAGALDLIKNVFKYAGRIQHADEATRAGSARDPFEFASGMTREEQPLGALESLAGGRLDRIGGIPRDTLLAMLGRQPAAQGAAEGATPAATGEQARQQALDAIAQESRTRSLGGSLEEMAARFADTRLHWARERVASLRVRATMAEAARPDEEDGGSR